MITTVLYPDKQILISTISLDIISIYKLTYSKKKGLVVIIWVAFAAHMKSSDAIDDIILTTAAAKDGVYVLGRKTQTLNRCPKSHQTYFP